MALAGAPASAARRPGGRPQTRSSSGSSGSAGCTAAAYFIDAASTSPQTFNALYASDEEIAIYTTGRLPIRPKRVNGDLPVDGRGRHSGRPGRVQAPPGRQSAERTAGQLEQQAREGLPGRRRPVGRGGTQRVDWLLAELARTRKHTPATVLGAANTAATADPRGLMWPVKAVLDRGTAQPARGGGGRPDHGLERA